MKFSVLLPTRNRLELLKYALASVLQQEEEDFEIIVSDNHSEEAIEAYIQSLNDARIKYYRTASFVSVTENWNNALDRSSGEWVVMLGDDDCLMKGYFKTMRELIERFPHPDFIYTHGFLFAYPRVLPQFPEGLAQTAGNAAFVAQKSPPRWLAKDEALSLVRQTFNFRCIFSFNMQFALINRSTIDRLRKESKFFHSPYPDYYAMTTLMLCSERIVSCPYPLVGVGISPKSFGYYYFNNIESKGVDFLNNAIEKEISKETKALLLPGTDMNTSWLLSMEKIKSYFQNYPLIINYRRYRLLQIIACLRRCQLEPQEARAVFKSLWKKLSFIEKCLYGMPWRALRFFPFILRRKFVGLLGRLAQSHVIHPSQRIHDRFENIQQFFERIDPHHFA